MRVQSYPVGRMKPALWKGKEERTKGEEGSREEEEVASYHQM